jgi:K+-sensing histidine kinase KdpD
VTAGAGRLLSRHRDGVPSMTPSIALFIGIAAIAGLTALFSAWLHLTNSTTVALSFLLVVLVVATVSTRWVAITVSLVAFLSFNYFFLPPLGTWTVADPQNWVALFTLLTVSLVASHLSAQVRRRAEEQRDAELLRRSSELKTALLASLGHDLKTPLTAARVAANNLDSSFLSDEQRREQSEIVRTELARLGRLFQDILEMARIETHAVAAEPEWVQPEEIIEAASAQVEHTLNGHKLHVDTATDNMLVRLDPRLTSAALAHVLENAAQYSPTGSAISVHVAFIPGPSPPQVSDSATRAASRAEAHPAAWLQGELEVSVCDRGPGISESDLTHIFERFYRGANARLQPFGSGMGLAITQGLLAAEGGRVWVENNPDRGATFTMRVPAVGRSAAGLESDTV